jgi:hypothetical protein
MRADRDQSYAQTEDSAPERLGSRGGRKSSERARCDAANRSQPYREAVSFNGRVLYWSRQFVTSDRNPCLHRYRNSVKKSKAG